MKKLINKKGRLPSLKFDLKMKLTIYLFLITLFQIQASTYSQNTKIDLSVKKMPISKIFDLIESKTEFKFLVATSEIDINRKVTIDKKNVRLGKILKEIFEGMNAEIEVVDKQILIKKGVSIIRNRLELTAQKTIIKGKVTNSSGNPLPGVNIIIEGGGKGTDTNFDGEYSINVSKGAVLVFSYVGMISQKIKVEDTSTINVVLAEDSSLLEEIILVGYGKTSKKKLVSAMSTVKTDKIKEAPYANVIEGLSGRVSGLFTRQSGGEYGSTPQISIRGGGEPVYVIDGIINSKEGFANIPPGDIESVSILKDAASAAVYGFSSLDGIVLVTTKMGKKSKMTLSYSSDFTIQRAISNPSYLSAHEFALLKNKASFSDGGEPIVNNETLALLKSGTDPRFPDLNIYNEAINQMALQKRHNIGLNGTTGNTSIFLSLDLFRQDGIYKANNFGLDRTSLRSNISHDFKKIGLKINSNTSLQRTVRDAPPAGTGTIWSHIRNWQPGNPIYNPKGNYVGNENPLAEADARAGYAKNESTRVNTRLELDWKVKGVKGLNLKAVGNYRLIYDFNKTWRANTRNSAPLYTWDENTARDLGKPSLSQNAGRSYNYTLEGHINYLRTFQKHTVEATGVYKIQESRNDSFSASRLNFSSPAVDQLFAGSGEGKDNSGNAQEQGAVSYISRLKYDYDAKYILEFVGTYDGYDGFAKGTQFKFFPAATFGWNVDREYFAESLLEKLNMSSLKIRASWGVLGDNGARFSHLSVYNLQNNAYYSGNAWRTGFSEGNLASSAGTTTWSERVSKNIAMDFGFFNDKLTGKIDYWYSRTTGFLGAPQDRYTLPLGKSLPQINIDNAQRRAGLDFELNYKSKIGNVAVNIGGNASFYDQLWEKTDESQVELSNPGTRTAQQTDFFTRGYTDLGYYQNTNDLLNSPKRLAATSTQLGDLRYQDTNGDGRIDGDDFTRIGKSNFPHMVYGVNLGASYKGFDINALFQGTGNRNIQLGNIWQNSINHKLYSIQDNSWSADNPNALFPRTSTFDGVNGNNNISSSTFWLKDAWYVRLKSLSISYDLKSILPNTVLKGVSKWNLVLSGTNLFTISPLTKYSLDPETSSNNNYGYPVGKNFNLGMRIAF